MHWEQLAKTGALVGGAVSGFFFGGWSQAMTLLVLMMALDYATGLTVAARGKSPKTEGGGLSSRVGLDGLIRKIMMIVLVAVAHVVDSVLGANIVQTAVVYFFIANEGLSILENAKLMGIDLPGILSNAFEVMKDNSEKTKIPSDSDSSQDDKKEE
jgi:toxin secretion/phage lysis holin